MDQTTGSLFVFDWSFYFYFLYHYHDDADDDADDDAVIVRQGRCTWTRRRGRPRLTTAWPPGPCSATCGTCRPPSRPPPTTRPVCPGPTTPTWPPRGTSTAASSASCSPARKVRGRFFFLISSEAIIIVTFPPAHLEVR